MSFIKKSYQISKGAIEPGVADLIYDYLLLKRKVRNTLFSKNKITNEDRYFGVYNDAQVPNTWSNYSDLMCEIVLYRLLPLMEDITKLELIPNYSYTRIYKNGDVLKKHIDRPSCAISTTIFLGGEEWPIYLKPKKEKQVEVNLKQGDMLVYKGCEFVHWRNKFKGQNCGQVFLHYRDKNEEGAMSNIFDGRTHLGLPHGE